MNINPNMIKFISAIRQSGDPEQMVINMLEQNAQGDPAMSSLLQMARNRDTQGLENFARNIAKEKGIDYDTELNSFRQMFGL